jgi:hypothetical protein
MKQQGVEVGRAQAVSRLPDIIEEANQFELPGEAV